MNLELINCSDYTNDEYKELVKKYKNDPESFAILQNKRSEFRDNGGKFKDERTRKYKKDISIEKSRNKFIRNEILLQESQKPDMWLNYRGYQVHPIYDFIREYNGDGEYLYYKNKRIDGIDRDLFIMLALKENQEKLDNPVIDYGGTKIRRIKEKYEFKSNCKMLYNSPLNMYIDKPDFIYSYIKVDSKRRNIRIKTYRTTAEVSEDLNVTSNFVRQACRSYESYVRGESDRVKIRLKNTDNENQIISRFEYSLNEDNFSWLLEDEEKNDSLVHERILEMEEMGWLR